MGWRHQYARVFVLHEPTQQHSGLPAGYRVELWRPSLRRIVPPTLGGGAGQYWLLHQSHLLGNRDYAVLLIRDGNRVVHRSCAIPGCLKWPFVRGRDLHVCMTWTEPDCRGRGLATYALAELVRLLSAPGRRFWYLAKPGNAASIAVCRKVGFRACGCARRRFVLGVPLQIEIGDDGRRRPARGAVREAPSGER